jgi:hypothetical protein
MTETDASASDAPDVPAETLADLTIAVLGGTGIRGSDWPIGGAQRSVGDDRSRQPESARAAALSVVGVVGGSNDDVAAMRCGSGGGAWSHGTLLETLAAPLAGKVVIDA